MALLRDKEKLLIQVLEDSPDSAMFVVQIRCRDPLLLTYWLRKTFFHNGQVQQTDVLSRQEGDGLEFVLRVLHRSRRLSNTHYWSPFVLALCLDALLFRYRLPQHQQWNGNLEQVMKDNTLMLIRSEEDENRPSRMSTLALS